MAQRILIVRLSHLGDVVCALGLFDALHAAYPTAEIGWVVQPEYAELLRGIPGLDRVLCFDRHGGWRAWPRIRRELRAFRPDLVVDAQGNLKSAVVGLCSGASRRAGSARRDWREPLGALLLNDLAPACASGERHLVHRMIALARHLAPASSLPLRPELGLTEEELAQGERLLGPEEGGVILHLSPPEDVRSWPAGGWEELARGARAAGRPVLCLSGPAEIERGRELERRIPAGPGLSHLIARTPLRRLAALFRVAAERAWRLVACDSGPMHLAWVNGLPVTVLEGPQDAERTGPWPTGSAGTHVALRAADSPSCAPCLARRCSHPEGPVCMERIDVSAVLAALD